MSLTRARQLVARHRLVLQACEFVLAVVVAVVPVAVARLLPARLVLAHPLSPLHSAAAALGALCPGAPPTPLRSLLLDAAESDLHR